MSPEDRRSDIVNGIKNCIGKVADAGDMDGNESLDIFDLGLMKRELLRADDPAMT